MMTTGPSPAHSWSPAAPSHAPRTIDLRPADAPRVGMIALLASEAAFFATLIVAYVVFLGQDRSGPTPADALSLPLASASTMCLLASSFTVHFASSALVDDRRTRFFVWLAGTILLGVLFLGGTAYEWRGLIYEHGLSIGTNLFGTTYFTLVGFHAGHVTLGLILLGLLGGLVWTGAVGAQRAVGFELVAWYWHFVDTVWIVVFAVVYVLGR